MSDRLLEMIQRVVRHEMAAQRASLLGVVTSIFPHQAEDDDNNYEVDVKLKHSELELRRVPVAVPHVGAAAAPREGDLVLVQFVAGDLNQPIVIGRLYHADDRPPLHRADEVIFEQRLPDGTLNQLRFSDDGSIYLQRDVADPENNSDALTSIQIDGASGDLVIKAGPSITITVANDASIDITADGKPINLTCSDMTVDCNAMTVNGDLVVSGAGTTTISGNTITGS